MTNLLGKKEAEERLEKLIKSNELPRGWQRITEEEFVKHTLFFYVTFSAVGYKQFTRKEWASRRISETLPEKEDIKQDIPYSATLFMFYDGTGVALSSRYWDGKIDFFRFGCKHDYKELRQEECRQRNIYHAGECYHVLECQKCGFIESHDSSG